MPYLGHCLAISSVNELFFATIKVFRYTTHQMWLGQALAILIYPADTDYIDIHDDHEIDKVNLCDLALSILKISC